MAIASSKEHSHMIEEKLALTPFYQGWGAFQQNIINVIAPLSAEQLALKAGPHHWTIGRVAQHIVGVRVWWFHVWMGEGSDDLAPILDWDGEHPPTCTAAELVAGLEATWRMIEQALARWTPADLEQVFSPPDSLSEAERDSFGNLTRQWILWHVLEHEILHSGELSLALGMYGLPTIY